MAFSIHDLVLFLFSLSALVAIPNCLCYFFGYACSRLSKKLCDQTNRAFYSPTPLAKNLAFYTLYTLIVNAPLSTPLLIDLETSEIAINAQSLTPYFAVLISTGFLGFGFLRTSTLGFSSLLILLASSAAFPDLYLLKSAHLSAASLFFLVATDLTFG